MIKINYNVCCIINEFGFKIKSEYIQKRNNKIREKIYNYTLQENVQLIKEIIYKYIYEANDMYLLD